MDFSELAAIGKRQHGLVSLTDLRSLGASKRVLDGLIDRGLLIRMHPGVFALPGVAPPLQPYAAAIMSAGPGSALSHRSAMTGWVVPNIVVDTIELVVPRGRNPIVRNAVVRRSSDLDPSHITMLDGLPITCPARTLVDASAVVPPFIVARAMESWLTRKLVTIADIEETIETLGRKGRNGVGAMRSLLAQRALGRSVADSSLEVLTAQLLIEAGLPVVHHHLVIDDGVVIAELDFAFVEERMYLESDGFGAHTMTRRTFDRDRTRQNDLIELDWLPMRFSDRQLRLRGRAAMATTRRNLAKRRRRLGLAPGT
ncbi:MAG: type IV toxin-antitoxin system AbiEi family antitoxin domain-containing protein [Acidimicrobiia bacterium]